MANKKLTDVILPAAALTAICVIISAALAFTDYLTKDAIAEANAKTTNETMATVFTEKNAVFREKQTTDFEYTEVTVNDKVSGYIFTVSHNGYGGEVKVMTGINTDGTVKAVRVISVDDETPGLGQNAKNNDAFTRQFAGKSGEISTEKNKEIEALTGATVTTNAVISSVNTALERYAALKGVTP